MDTDYVVVLNRVDRWGERLEFWGSPGWNTDQRRATVYNTCQRAEAAIKRMGKRMPIDAASAKLMTLEDVSEFVKTHA